MAEALSRKARHTILKDATIITVDTRRRIILNGYVHIRDDRILRVSSGTPSDIPEDAEVISLPGRIIIPGLINTHAHLAQSLLRGLAEDLPLHSWLCDRIWPLEAAYIGDDGYIAARLTIAEMLLSGTTTFLEAMCTPTSGFGNVARAVEEMGIRACLGKLVQFAGTSPAVNIKDARNSHLEHMSIGSLTEAHEKHHNTCSGRLHVWAALGTPRGAPAPGFAQVVEACRNSDMGITMHCAEAPADLHIYQSVYSCSPAQFCASAGLLGRKTVLAHMVHLDLPTDLALLAESGTSVAHNPTSNLKLGSGVAAVPDMLTAGVNVSLGTDGAPCNNSYDMLREMHLASVLHKGLRQDAKGVFGAHEALEMATIYGARALGMEEEVGRLEKGKKADLVVVDARGIGHAPWDAEEGRDGGMDPVSLLVGGCTGRDVEMVMVDGRVLVREGRLVHVDEREIMEDARRCVKGIRERSGVKVSVKDGWVVE